MLRVGLIASVLLASAAKPVCAAQYWLADRDPVTQGIKQDGGPADYMALFAPGAPWAESESHLTVFKVSAQFVMRGTDDMVSTVVNTLHQHHVGFAIEMGAVQFEPGECGGGEGYAASHLVDRLAGKLQRLGLTLDYWAMDEPLWFAHERTWGRNGCAYPVDAVAERVARNVADMRRHFPNIVVGDVEVLSGNHVPPPQLLADYTAFAQAFQRDTGRPLAFIHWDVSWRSGGAQLIHLFSRQMRAQGLRVGVIIGGDMPDPDDASWVSDSLQHARDLAGEPDDYIVQSWKALPSHMLPETDPSSATYELLQTERLGR